VVAESNCALASDSSNHQQELIVLPVIDGFDRINKPNAFTGSSNECEGSVVNLRDLRRFPTTSKLSKIHFQTIARIAVTNTLFCYGIKKAFLPPPPKSQIHFVAATSQVRFR
jgi:hypothetical protein